MLAVARKPAPAISPNIEIEPIEIRPGRANLDDVYIVLGSGSWAY